ncbi:MAG TPA: c-type cytochrome domain-containing protein, partial [Pirellulales bacterium]
MLRIVLLIGWGLYVVSPAACWADEALPSPAAQAKVAVESSEAKPDAEAPALDPKQVEYFEKEVRPLLAARCDKCHSSQSEKVRGGLYLDTRAGWTKGGDSGPAIIPGD